MATSVRISDNATSIHDTEGDVSDDDDSEQCLEELLGGISFGAISDSEWKDDDDEDDEGEASTSMESGKLSSALGHGLVDPKKYRNESSIRQKRQQRPLNSGSSLDSSPRTTSDKIDADVDKDRRMFQNAYTVCDHQSNGHHIEFPPVRIQDFGAGKGHGLVATRYIPKGSTIYTERSAVAVQLPVSSMSSDVSRRKNMSFRKRPRACQACFRSLEDSSALFRLNDPPATAGEPTKSNHDDPPKPVEKTNPEDPHSQWDSIPFPNLWPVQRLEFEQDNQNCDGTCHPKEDPLSNDESRERIRVDKYGRVQCIHCEELFCSRRCYDQKIHDVGSCCIETMILRNMISILSKAQYEESSSLSSSPIRNEAEMQNNTLQDDSHDEHSDYDIQTPVVLATIIFLQTTQWYRDQWKICKEKQNIDSAMSDPTSLSLSENDHWIFHVCGESEDVNPLELGIQCIRRDQTSIIDKEIQTTTTTMQYTLNPLYEYVADNLRLTENERLVLSSTLFHRLAAKAARNGFGLRTKSPFQTYYQSLLGQSRISGGRQSESHIRHKIQLARVITGGTSDQLERGMDRQIDGVVSPEVSALFALTTQCNHSCRPNAQVMCPYADASIDVVALQDISPGDEILISYISLGHQVGWGRPRSTPQRRRELRMKYLFECNCEECSS